MVSNATLLSYVLFTTYLTEWRTKFLREKNVLENQASSLAMESLINYETVKYFGKESFESDRYVNVLKGVQTVRDKDTAHIRHSSGWRCFRFPCLIDWT